MTTDSQVHDVATTVAATSVATTSRTNALPAMAPAEKPKKLVGIDFKRWQQKNIFLPYNSLSSKELHLEWSLT
ncbi:hypothetical protein P3S67_022980 [Capsicum chacoense]